MWYGQINRTIWEIEKLLEKRPRSFRLRKELLRAHFLQRYEYDRNFHVPRDDRTFLFLQEGPSPVCLLLHGAQGTPAEMRELGGFLYSRGYSVYCPRFERTDAKGRHVSWESWVTDAEISLATVMDYSKEAFVVGLSFGATISIVLAQIHSIKGIAMLAPALYPKLSLKERFYGLGRKFVPTVFYNLAGWDGEVIKAMEAVRMNPRRLDVPVLALQARDDSRLSNKGLKWIRRCASDPKSEVILLPHGSHVLPRGSAKDEVFGRIYNFFQKI